MALRGLVVVSGLPGSGKSTLAVALAGELGLPLLAKDAVKEALFDALSPASRPEGRDLGRAALAVVLALAARAPGAVVESYFWPGTAESELIALGRPMVQVHCECPEELCDARYRARAVSGERHPAHGTETVEASLARRRTVPSGPLALEAPLVRVDTSVPVDDVGGVAARVLAAMPGGQALGT